jgi:hypothetical protein
MFKKAAFLTAPVWLVLVALGSLQVLHADEQHKSFLESINASVKAWLLQLDSLALPDVAHDFYGKMTECSYGWTLTCRKFGPDPDFRGPAFLAVDPDTPMPSTGGFDEVLGIPAAAWYAITTILSAGWLADLVLALAIMMAILLTLYVKACQNLLFVFYFPTIFSVLVWLAKSILALCLHFVSGLIALLILVFGLLSWIMWIKDIWEAGKVVGAVPEMGSSKGRP